VSTLTAERPPAAAIDAAFAQLSDLLGDRASRAPGMRSQHAGGEGIHAASPPDAVVFPVSTDEVAAVVKICVAAGVPIVPFGAGTSLEGHVAALRGGVAISLVRMDRVLEVNDEDLDCRIEAGVTREALNAHLRDRGLFFPLDPGANATLGGMAATRASGTNAVRYGTMREVTLGLTVVTADGEIIRTGGRARKSSAGYDLTRLFIGSEGTLGIITEVQLRLFGIPEQIASGVCVFDDVESAVGAVTMIIQLGVPIARIEFLDALQMKACIGYSKLEGFAEKPTLFLEFHGSPTSVADQIGQVQGVIGDFGGSDFRWATKEEERSALWKARHNAYHAAKSLGPGKHALTTDACVPISALPAVIAEAQAEAARTGLICPIVGHVGDGNFHVMILYDAGSDAETADAEALSHHIARSAIAHGGTCTGEHGIGMHKLDLLEEEHGAGVAVMRQIKRALDPHGLFNPGKTVPA
jgi:D-lactate dehydrogenase (cytochrome)